jgi:hypothetical protein
MINRADLDRARYSLHGLGVAAEAKVRIGIHQQLAAYRAVGCMANRASFAHRLMFEGDGSRLFAMALGAGFIQPRHGQATAALVNVTAVRVMTLDAVHAALDNRMMLRQIELSVSIQMAPEARRRVLARIDDELAFSASRRNVEAARTMARFATALALGLRAGDMQPRMGARWKSAADVRVAIVACTVSRVARAGDI